MLSAVFEQRSASSAALLQVNGTFDPNKAHH
jgi:hypothetical protein